MLKPRDTDEKTYQLPQGTYRRLLATCYSEKRFFITSKDLIITFGLSDGAILSYLIGVADFHSALKKEGWFYQTQIEIWKDTGVSTSTLEVILGRLKKKGVLRTKRIGLPAQRYFQIDHELIQKLVERKIEEREPELHKLLENNKRRAKEKFIEKYESGALDD